jgi:hypothetical protein
MMRRRAKVPHVPFPATAGKRSGSPAGAAGMLAILVALARASSDIEKDAAMNADDDTKCQSAGFQYGTPEYSQCRESIVSKRTTARDIPLGPTSAPMR